MIFILTFNLVVVSGSQAGEVMRIARQRLLTIVMGFVICIFTNLLVLPNWASDQLHISTASKFEHLASSIEGNRILTTVAILSSKHHSVGLVTSHMTDYYLSTSMAGLLDKYFEAAADEENEADGSLKICKSVLHSKAKDESLVSLLSPL